MTTRPLTPRLSIDDAKLQETIDTMRRLLDDFEDGVRLEPDVKTSTKRGLNAAGLVARARRGTRDGYPTSSLGGGGSGGVSDRVGQLVTEGWSEHAACAGEGCDECSDGFIARPGAGDPVRAAGVRFVRHLRRALDELGAANGDLYGVSSVLPPPDEVDIWCVVHRRFGMYEPIGVGGRDDRCQWCYGFKLDYGVDPVLELLELRAQGDRRITVEKIKQAMPHLFKKKARR